MRYHDSSIMMETYNPPSSFQKQDESKRSSFEEEEELELEDVFNASHSSAGLTNSISHHHSSSILTNSISHHSLSEESLIRQFNASVGSKSLERSVAEFFLEMAAGDLETAVGFFKEQGGGQQQQPEAPIKPSAPAPPSRDRALGLPKRSRSFEPAPPMPSRYTPIGQRHRRFKSYDIAEAACVTAPSAYRSDHSRYPAPKSFPRGTAALHRPCSRPPRNGAAQFSHRTQGVHHRGAPLTAPRLPSERYFSRPIRRTRSDSHSKLHSSLMDLDYGETPTVTQRPLHNHSKLYSSMRDLDYSEAPTVTGLQ